MSDVDLPPFASMTDDHLAAYHQRLRTAVTDMRELGARYASLLAEPLVTAPTAARLHAHRADLTARVRVLELTMRAIEHEQHTRALIRAGGRCADQGDWAEDDVAAWETEPGTDPGWRSEEPYSTNRGPSDANQAG